MIDDGYERIDEGNEGYALGTMYIPRLGILLE